MTIIANLSIYGFDLSQHEKGTFAKYFVKSRNMITSKRRIPEALERLVRCSVCLVKSGAHEYRITGARSRKIFVTSFHVPEPKGFSSFQSLHAHAALSGSTESFIRIVSLLYEAWYRFLASYGP